MLAQNYHLSVSFVEGSKESSGVALKIRNQELMDGRKSDVEKYKRLEYKMFEVEERILAVELAKDAGFLLNVDYEESTEILSDKEQRERWDWDLANGLIDRATILMQRDPDKFPDKEAAEDYLFELSGAEEEMEEAPTSPLLEALTTPV
jgi:hypothetical protein